MSARIRVLAPEVANRIAAGEVIERPASVLKELLENALDAGATSIEVALEEGGIKGLRVHDDGEGMGEQDLRTCVLPHATSKISDVDDLFRVASFGFRGEALPSIASVADLTITTRTEDAEEAIALHTRGGEAVTVRPAAGKRGTVVQVRELFFNVPARRHFLKQARTELAHCLEMVTRIALAEPGLEILVTHEGKRSMHLPPVEDRGARIKALHGKKLGGELLPVHGEDQGLRMEAWIGPPSLVRATARHQVLYLNGRWIRDRSLLHAFKDAYRGLIMPKEHPVGFLFVDIDPALVDVNVHPTKTEVRFRERDRVFSFVRRTVVRTLEATRADPGVRLKTGGGADEVAEVASAPSAERQRLATELPPEAQSRLFDRDLHAPGAPGSGATDGDAPATPAPAVAERPRPKKRGWANRCHELTPAAERDLPVGAEARFLQVHKSYLVVETSAGLRIIDQHALHERKIFEELKARFRGGPGEQQRLLVPEVLELSAVDQALVLEHAEELARAGFEIEAFGGNAVAVQAVPAIVAHMSPEKMIEPIIGTLSEAGQAPGTPDVLLRTLGNLACKAAVTFNTELDPAEIRTLLAWAEENPEARNCPHGRPVALQLSMEELELQFARKK